MQRCAAASEQIGRRVGDDVGRRDVGRRDVGSRERGTEPAKRASSLALDRLKDKPLENEIGSQHQAIECQSIAFDAVEVVCLDRRNKLIRRGRIHPGTHKIPG